MATIANKGLKSFFLICVLLMLVFIWQNLSIDSSTFLSKRSMHGKDNKVETLAEDVVDRRNVIQAVRELLVEKEDTQQPSRHVICPSFNGGLGNMMFQYASAYGIGRRAGLDVLVRANSDIYQVFDVWAKVTADKSVCTKAKVLREKKSAVFENTLFAVRPDANYAARGYLLSWRYFDQFRTEIKQQFRFRGDIEKKAYETIRSLLEKKYGQHTSRTLVGVHVRRGNLLNKHEKQYGYLVADKAFINRALDYFRRKHRQVTFIVCSNDMKWSKANVTGSDVIYIDGQAREVDLAILSSMNHTIMTVGNFGWWAAWLTNGTTVYYKNFVKNGTNYADQFLGDRSDFIYPGWIGL